MDSGAATAVRPRTMQRRNLKEGLDSRERERESRGVERAWQELMLSVSSLEEKRKVFGNFLPTNVGCWELRHSRRGWSWVGQFHPIRMCL